MLNSSFPARFLALTVLACAVPASARAGADPRGVWINDTGRGAVEIKDCGGALCGHVVWVKDATDTKGCGKQIIGEARHAGGSTWGGGWVYSPEKKKRYDVELTPVGDDKLRVVGFAGIKLFSRTMVWKRAPGDLVRCGSTTVANAKPEKSEKAEPEIKGSASPVPASPPPAKPEVKPAAPDSAALKTPSPETAKAEQKKAEPSKPDVAEVQPVAKPEVKDKAVSVTPPAAAPPASAETETVQNDDGSDSHTSGSELPDLSELAGKFLKKTRDGNCKLDQPWDKIEYGCE